MSAFDSPDIEVSPQRAGELLAEGVTVIDVREGYERDAGYIDGTRHIELERLAGQADTIDQIGTGRLPLPARRPLSDGCKRFSHRGL